MRPHVPKKGSSPSTTLETTRAARNWDTFSKTLICSHLYAVLVESVISIAYDRDTGHASLVKLHISLTNATGASTPAVRKHDPLPYLCDGIDVLLSQPTVSSIRRKLIDPGRKPVDPGAVKLTAPRGVPAFLNRIADEFISGELGASGKIGITYDPQSQTVFFSTRDLRCPFGAVHGGKSKSAKGSKNGACVTEGNHFYFVLYLLHGYMIQKCHSTKCHNARSDRIKIPQRFMSDFIKHNQDAHSVADVSVDDTGETLPWWK